MHCASSTSCVLWVLSGYCNCFLAKINIFLLGVVISFHDAKLGLGTVFSSSGVDVQQDEVSLVFSSVSLLISLVCLVLTLTVLFRTRPLDIVHQIDFVLFLFLQKIWSLFIFKNLCLLITLILIRVFDTIFNIEATDRFYYTFHEN